MSVPMTIHLVKFSFDFQPVAKTITFAGAYFCTPIYGDSYPGTQMRRKFKAKFHQLRYHLTTSSMPSVRRRKHLVFRASKNMRVL
jgi:hypothetical protein